MSTATELSLVYLVRWADGITKAGFTSGRRWRTFEIRGARVLGIWSFPGWNEALRSEVKMSSRLNEWPLAWEAKSDVDDRLGRTKAGYRECHRVPLEVPDSCLVAMLASIAQEHCGAPFLHAMHGRTDVRRQSVAYSLRNRYRFLTATGGKTTGNGHGGVA